jgi:hypothetical protein
MDPSFRWIDALKIRRFPALETGLIIARILAILESDMCLTSKINELTFENH